MVSGLPANAAQAIAGTPLASTESTLTPACSILLRTAASPLLAANSN